MRAHNSKKNNYSPNKIERLKQNKIKYELLGKQMEGSRSPQVSTTDPDARALLVQGQVVEVSYNMQAAVDDKLKLVVATHTINKNDRNALSATASEAKGGREIDRTEFAETVEENSKRYKENAELYRKRQEINEHIFGTIKRKWGYNHTNLKGLKKVNGEFALIMTVYNMRRSINILGFEELMTKFKNWQPSTDFSCSIQKPICSSCCLYPERLVISNQVIHYTFITNTNEATCFQLYLLRLRGLIGSSIYSAPTYTPTEILVPVFT